MDIRLIVFRTRVAVVLYWGRPVLFARVVIVALRRIYMVQQSGVTVIPVWVAIRRTVIL